MQLCFIFAFLIPRPSIAGEGGRKLGYVRANPNFPGDVPVFRVGEELWGIEAGSGLYVAEVYVPETAVLEEGYGFVN